jgi:hypothetical protein
MKTHTPEIQAYKVIKLEKDYEIRHYPSMTVAVVSSREKTYEDLGQVGFTKLQNYISGGNKDKIQIAMVSPVHMQIGKSGSTICFVMPATCLKENLPLPDDSSVTLKTVLDKYVAVIDFEDFASVENIKKHTDVLENSLKQKHISYYGDFQLLVYGPRYELLETRNEIIVTLNWNSR